MVKPGAAVIDIGINQVTGPDGQTMIVGDVDTDAVKEVASWVTPGAGRRRPGDRRDVHAQRHHRARQAARRRLARLSGSAKILWPHSLASEYGFFKGEQPVEVCRSDRHAKSVGIP